MMHAANSEKSGRLQRVLSVLRQAGKQGVSSRELQEKSRTVAPGTCVSELRKSGYVIDCEHLVTYGDGTKVYLYRLIASRKEGEGFNAIQQSL